MYTCLQRVNMLKTTTYLNDSYLIDNLYETI